MLRLFSLGMSSCLWISFAWTATNDAVLPFQLIGNTMIVEATAGDQTGSFIVDFGSPSLVLNDQYFENKKNKTDLFQAVDLIGKSTNVERTVIRFQVSEIISRGQEAFLMDLSPLEELKGIKILGVIGVDFFDRFEMLIDYERKELVLYALNSSGERKTNAGLDTSPSQVLELKRTRHLLYFEIQIGDEILKWGLDCGAEMNVADKESLRKIKTYFKPSHTVSIVAFNGKKATANVGTLEPVVIGNMIMDIPEVVATDLGLLNRHLIADLDGLFGYNFLSQQKIAINFRKRTLAVWDPAWASVD